MYFFLMFAQKKKNSVFYRLFLHVFRYYMYNIIDTFPCIIYVGTLFLLVDIKKDIDTWPYEGFIMKMIDLLTTGIRRVPEVHYTEY